MEHRRGLSDYALFLKGCCNTMQDVEFVEEMNNPSNMKKVVLKLPFKLSERWRTVAYDHYERIC